MVVRMTSDMEMYVVAVERMEEYADCPKEVQLAIHVGKFCQAKVINKKCKYRIHT